LDSGGRAGGKDKNVVINEEGVDKDSTPSIGWDGDDGEVFVNNDDVDKDSDACCWQVL
jgi:hypothetical protein